MTYPVDQIVTFTVRRCGCPAGNHSATAPRLALTTFDDNPVAAGLKALREAYGDEAYREALDAIRRQAEWDHEVARAEAAEAAHAVHPDRWAASV